MRFMGEDILPLFKIAARRKASNIARQTKDKIRIGNNIGNSNMRRERLK
jgi:hypothetical protein